MARIFLIAGEASGDQLGASLMAALRARHSEVSFSGVGGEAMTREGLKSLFPLSEIAVMGLIPVIPRVPRLMARIDETARAVVDMRPDCLVIIDAPDFTHRVARRVRQAIPELPIVDYVSPTVWAWRPGRAAAMRSYVDHVLALLPFEPDAHLRLGGPPCTYVGHPLIERVDELTRSLGPSLQRKLLLILPGSRVAEVERLMPIYGQAAALLRRRFPDLEIAIPVVPHVRTRIEEMLRDWPVAPRLVSQCEKYAAFRSARAALVTSGVATLELALAGVPMAVAYKVSRLEALLKFLITVDSIVLPNLVIGERAVPEFLQERATARELAQALEPLIAGWPSREAQLLAFSRVREEMLKGGLRPSDRAAAVVLGYATAESS